MHKQNGFVTWLVMIIVVVVVVAGVGFAFLRLQKKDADSSSSAAPLTSLIVPYYDINDLSAVGPYSTNKALAGYEHNGLDFMSSKDLVEFRSISSGKITELKISMSSKHPQVSMIVQYDKNTLVDYTFEPYSDDMAVAERQLTLMNVKLGDTITAGQSLGKLIKTAPQSHVHVHINRNNTAFCIENLFPQAARDEMLKIAAVAPNVPAQLCYE